MSSSWKGDLESNLLGSLHAYFCVIFMYGFCTFLFLSHSLALVNKAEYFITNLTLRVLKANDQGLSYTTIYPAVSDAIIKVNFKLFFIDYLTYNLLRVFQLLFHGHPLLLGRLVGTSVVGFFGSDSTHMALF